MLDVWVSFGDRQPKPLFSDFSKDEHLLMFTSKCKQNSHFRKHHGGRAPTLVGFTFFYMAGKALLGLWSRIQSQNVKKR